MRLDFNVLWVEDQPSRVEAQIQRIKRGMEDHGFDFKPAMCTAVAEVQARITDQVFTDQIDLVLVDWDLGNQVYGQSVISEIREKVRYKDVIFYSAQKNADELRKLAFDNSAEGVYCVSREDLVDEVLGVFESLVKKVLDLDHVRGIVMGSTSDIDDMILDALEALHQAGDAAAKAAMLDRALALIDQKVADMAELAGQLRQSRAFQDILAQNGIFTANDRLRTLAHALELDSFRGHHGYRAAVVGYMNEVVPKRNKLGHRVLVPIDGPNTGAQKAQQMSLDETRELRRLLLNLRGEFRALLTALVGAR